MIGTRPFAAFVILISSLSGAQAQTEIARVVRVATLASVQGSGASRTLVQGAGLVANEWVRTDRTGRAELRFTDDTQVTIGPGSSLKLDRFVYAPGGAAGSLMLDATKGLFRFTTGRMPKPAYQIRTPVGVLGVRGTQFTFRVQANRVVVSVAEGRVTACPRSNLRAGCTEAGPGQSLVATARAVAVQPTSTLPGNLSLPTLPALRLDLPSIRTDAPVPLPRAVDRLGTSVQQLPGLGRPGNTLPGLGGGGGSLNLPRLGR